MTTFHHFTNLRHRCWFQRLHVQPHPIRGSEPACRLWFTNETP